MSNEIKVGILLLAALAVLVWLSVTSGTLGFGKDEAMRELSAVFSNVEGIKEDSPVKMAGVDVGKVTRVELQPNGTAVLRFKVRQSVALPADVSAQMATSGLIGERFVALVPGEQGSKGDGGALAANVTQLPVIADTDPAKIKADFAKVANDMQGVTSMLKQVLGNPENAAKLQQIIDSMATFSNGLGNNGGQMMQDLGTTAHNLAKISNDLKSGNSLLGQLTAHQASSTQPDLNETLREMNVAMKDFRTIMDKVNSGQGTLGRLVNDSSTADKLDSTLDNVGELAGGLRGWVGGGSGGSSKSSDRVSGTVRPQSSVDGGTQNRLSALGAEASMETVGVLGEDSVLKGQVATRIRAGDKFVDLGVQGDGFAAKTSGADNVNGPYYGKDFGNEWKYSAQVGEMVGDNVALRAGLKNSTAGVGADVYGRVPLTDKGVRYSADAYDFTGTNTPGDRPHVDLTARADLTKRIYGVIGYDNVLSENYGGPMLGVGLKFGNAGPVASSN